MIKSKLDKIIIKDNEYIYVTNSKNIVVKYVLPLGSLSKNVPTGYIHLLEHLYIKANHRYLTKLENLGVHFNGVTRENHMEIILIDPSGEVLNEELNNFKLDNLFKTEFTDKELEIEKDTIIQEHKMLQKTIDHNNVNITLGSIDEIKKFNLRTLNNIRKNFEKDFKKIIFKNIKVDNIYSTNKIEWVSKVEILGYITRDGNISLSLKDNFYSEIFIYVINILLDPVFRLQDIKLVRNNDMVTLNIPVSYDKLIHMVENHKINAYDRYNLKLKASFKFLSDQVTYIINHFYKYGLISELYYLDNWEKILYARNSF